MKPYYHLQDEILGNTSLLLHRYNTIASTMDDPLLASIKSVSNAEIAFSNGWKYGVPIAVGKITKWDLYNIVPMNPVVSTIDLTGEEIIKMLEENLERTFSADPMKQMGGYVKTCLSIQVKMRIENPEEHRIQQIFIENEPLVIGKTYKAAFVTMQGVPKQFGNKKKVLSIKAVDAMAQYLILNPEYEAKSCHTFSLV